MNEYVDEDMQKECPECGGMMKPVLATEYDIKGYGDDTNMQEWWVCIDCEYYE